MVVEPYRVSVVVTSDFTGVYHLNQLTHGWIIDYYVHDSWMKAIAGVPCKLAGCTKRGTTSGFELSEPAGLEWLRLKDQSKV